MKSKKILMAFMILSVIGFIISSYLLYIDMTPDGSSICDINQRFSCSAVANTPYAYIFGVPTAFLGMLCYAFFFTASLWIYKGWSLRKVHPKLKRLHLHYLLALGTGFGLFYSLWLTYAEFFIIRALCIFCLTHQVIILVMFFMALVMAMFYTREIKLEI